MANAVFKDTSGPFKRKHAAFVDYLLGHMSMNIEIGLKTTAGMPVDKGQMKAATRHFRNGNGQFRVEVNKDYAAVQEKGERNGRRFRNYTTSGTGSGFFARAIAAVIRQRDGLIAEARRAVGL